MIISKIEHTSYADSARDFFKTFDHASKYLQVPLSMPKVEIGSKKSEDNLFAHYYDDVIEHPKRRTHLSFRFRNRNYCIFSIKMFELHGNDFVLTEIVNLSCREFHHLYKNRFYVANKWEKFEINYDV